uniref:Uncharacterized protein n=1 Tax=Glossina austeni TaxID=7395 RepID=A0A1A9VBR9_GLOAU
MKVSLQEGTTKVTACRKSSSARELRKQGLRLKLVDWIRKHDLKSSLISEPKMTQFEKTHNTQTVMLQLLMPSGISNICWVASPKIIKSSSTITSTSTSTSTSNIYSHQVSQKIICFVALKLHHKK